MTAKPMAIDLETPKATADIGAERACLRCQRSFWSEGFGERICKRCKGTVEWRSAVPGGDGKSRRRSGGRSS